MFCYLSHQVCVFGAMHNQGTSDSNYCAGVNKSWCQALVHSTTVSVSSGYRVVHAVFDHGNKAVLEILGSVTEHDNLHCKGNLSSLPTIKCLVSMAGVYTGNK